MKKPDLRTRKGRRAEIREQVKRAGGFSVFWITEFQLRAIVGEEMFERGEIVETKKREFPWYSLKLKG
jgi:hypothetical protein